MPRGQPPKEMSDAQFHKLIAQNQRIPEGTKLTIPQRKLWNKLQKHFGTRMNEYNLVKKGKGMKKGGMVKKGKDC